MTSRALADYSEVIPLAPKATVGYQERGSIYQRVNQFRRPVDDENEAVKIDPAIAYACYLRGDRLYKA
jgi:hypothetical protein